MPPRKTSDGRGVPALLGARQRTMAMLAVVLEDEARRDAPRRRRLRSEARERVGFMLATAVGCVFAAVVGGVAAWWVHTPELDALEDALRGGDGEQLNRAFAAVDGASSRARSARAYARAQQAVWGQCAAVEARLALQDGDGPHAPAALELLQAMAGEDEQHRAWPMGIAAGRSLDLSQIDAAIVALERARRPAGAMRTLAALKFVRGDVVAAASVLTPRDTAHADAAYHQAWTEGVMPAEMGHVPGRAALLVARTAVYRGDTAVAHEALAQARTEVLPWDPVATTSMLRLYFLTSGARGLRAWSQDLRFSASVRELAMAYADAVEGHWDAAEVRLRSFDARAPWVAYVRGYAAAEQGRWADAVRAAAVARRGMPGRAELDVLAAWAAAHVFDAEDSAFRLERLSEDVPWAPRVWTARADAEAAAGRSSSDVQASFERALEVEQRPASAAAALASGAVGEEALHLWQMAVELQPSQVRYRVALGRAQVERGRLHEAWRTLESLPLASPDEWRMLVRLALARPGALDPRVEQWLAWSVEAADADSFDVLRASVKLARGDHGIEDALETARKRVSDEAAVVLGVRALARADRLAAARRLASRARRRLTRSQLAQVKIALAVGLREHGEIREAAQVAFNGWSTLGTASSLVVLPAAHDAIEIWLELGNTSGARAIARELTTRLPHSPDAWVLRARVQAASGAPGYACASIGRARALDPNVDTGGVQCRSEPV